MTSRQNALLRRRLPLTTTTTGSADTPSPTTTTDPAGLPRARPPKSTVLTQLTLLSTMPTVLGRRMLGLPRNKPGETPGTIVLPTSPLFQGTLLLTPTTLPVLDPRWVEELLPEAQVGLWLPTTELQTPVPCAATHDNCQS